MKPKQNSINTKSIKYYNIFLIFGLFLVSCLVSITQVFAEGENNSNTVSSNSSANASVTVSAACGFNVTRATGYDNEKGYTDILANNASTEITGSTFTTICNDSGGYAIYAVGYGNNTLGETDLISANGSSNIATSSSPASGASYWQMKLTAATENQPVLENGYNNYSAIPSTYTKVASYSTITDPASSGTRTGQAITAHYKAYASSTQPADTYAGAVKYTMVHPGTIPAPIIMIDDLEYMQDFATLTSAEKTSVLSSMTAGTTYTLKDKRDEQEYTIAKLKDGNVWMTQNLDLCIGCTGVDALTSENTDLNEYGSGVYSNGYTVSDGVIIWAPASTAITSNYPIIDNVVTDWADDASVPYSAEGGDIYYYTNNLNEQYTLDTKYTSKDECMGGGHTAEECVHYHIGNYYNQTAAIASNNSSQFTERYAVAANSICPAGWRLPKGAAAAEYSASTHEISQLLYTSGITLGLDSNQYNADGFINIRKSPLYFVRGGYVYSGQVSGAAYRGYYRSSTIINYMYSYGLDFEKRWAIGGAQVGRSQGMPVRCLAR